ncbi:MAG: GyrI-like domain-containing protein [Acidimicrobiia bacterium]|nr:GyrI-like domain-containing protein [Acidimicrobiia bacterium]
MSIQDVELVDRGPETVTAMHGDVPMAELPEFFGRAFGRVMEAAISAGVSIVGPPVAFYPTMPDETVHVEAGFPTSAPIEPDGDVHSLELPAVKAVVGLHVGPYEALESAYNRVMAWASEQGLQPAGMMWEYYLTDPQAEPDPAKWETKVVWPVIET